MQDKMARELRLPKGMPTARYKPPPSVEVPAGLEEIPLFDDKTPAEKQIQEHWIAHVRVFDLSDTKEGGDLEDYTRIWQMICDGLAQKCEHRTEFVESKGTFVALLRWAEFRYKVPEEKR